MKSSLWDLFRRRKKMTRPLKPLPHAVPVLLATVLLLIGRGAL